MSLSDFDQAVLKVLRSGPNYGLGVIRALEAAGVNAHQGNVYPALWQLESNGYLESYAAEDMKNERGGYARRYYRVVTKGYR